MTLERIVNQNDLSGMSLNARARFVRTSSAARELDVPWIQILLTQSWKTRLAEDFAWAFQKGVAGILSRTFRVPLEEIDRESEGIDLKSSSTEHSVWTDEHKEETESYVSSMLEENLQNLYKNIDPVSIELILKMKPIDCRFENAFVVPMLTRDMVREKPSMKGLYQKIEQEYGKSKDLAKVRQMAEQLAKDTGFSGMRTVIADVSIDCLETFQVRNVSNDSIVQGDGTVEDKVTHVVRFEIVRSRNKDPDKQLGSWQIIDWDDQLDGNIWH